jgi:16S rRNA G966 N2-methylase RsmD
MLSNKSKVLTYLENNSLLNKRNILTFGDVPTPIAIVEEMLDMLPEYVWINPDLKWLDPCAGLGVFSVCIYYRLLRSLTIPIEERSDHILKNMLYAVELNKDKVNYYKEIMGDTNIYSGDYMNYDEKFDIIIGNPPYNKSVIKKIDKGSHTSSSYPIFKDFIIKGTVNAKLSLFISPSRWIKSSNRQLRDFKNCIFQSNKLSIVRIIKNPFNVNIEDCAITLYDQNHNGKCKYLNGLIKTSKYDILVDPKNLSILEKIIKYENTLITRWLSTSYYGILACDKNIHDKKIGNDVVCYINKRRGTWKWFPKNKILNKRDYLTHRVGIAASNGYNSCFGNLIYIKPNEVYSTTYAGILCKDKKECKNLISYLRTRFANFCLSLRKVTQSITPDVCKWIPLPPLDRLWNDDKIALYFSLSEKEKSIISLYSNGKINNIYQGPIRKRYTLNELKHMSVNTLIELARKRKVKDIEPLSILYDQESNLDYYGMI